jgi:penicillin G amidase
VIDKRHTAFLCLVCVATASAGCRRTPPAPPPLAPQTSGTIAVEGLSAPVRVVRDVWGIPHIYAQSQNDLFIAQGFVQAEDRLFQMDLWKRAAQGRLSEVLGANFVERDAMTRRVQYRGDADAEWASYGPDAKAIADAFVRGVNAWVALARERPPEEFLLAGWKPEPWTAADLLSRTDAFVASRGAMEDVRRQRLSDVVADQIRRVGAPPVFVSLAAPVPEPLVRSRLPPAADERLGTVSAPPGRAQATRDGIAFTEARRTLELPSSRYFVHLHAEGWNVIGATRPWLPGVAIGHNDRVAWAPAPLDRDTQSVAVERDDMPGAGARTVVRDPIVIKGRAAPFVFETMVTPHGFVIASDREQRKVFTLRWSGTEAGAAAELGSLALDRARDWNEFREALAHWKMPVAQIVYADVDGNVGFQDAGLVPIRRRNDWTGWRTLDDLAHAFNPSGRSVGSTGISSGASIEPRALFIHPLAVTANARQRFDIQVARPSPDDSPVRAMFDPSNWDRAQAINAPGQSAFVGSAHYADLAALWAEGNSIGLPFSDAAVQQHAQATLMLVPKR